MIQVSAGFLPLLDAAILIAAREMGFAAEQDIDLKLSRETSWANIRDRVSVGQFDVAHMLAPLPIAQNLGLSPLLVKLVAPFALGLGGNAITVSNALWSAMADAGGPASHNPADAGAALRNVLLRRKASGLPIITLAVVHSYSAHAYELRYWLAACGIDPHHGVTITIVPPGLMPGALASGAIDGFCVGEPWNSVAVVAGAGHIATTKSAIWRSSPEKVLGLTLQWAERHPETLDRLLLALHSSAQWCANPASRQPLAELLARPEYLGVAPDILLQSLEGRPAGGILDTAFLQFYERAANFPWQSHALWFYSQMARWQQVSLSAEGTRAALATYRPDIYRRALNGAAIALPGGSSKVEGGLSELTHVPALGGRLALGPDGFFDGVKFDPDEIAAYIAGSPYYCAVHNN